MLHPILCRHTKFLRYSVVIYALIWHSFQDRAAPDMGLEGDDLREALANDLYLENVLADEREVKKLGLSGVPAFVANRRIALRGVQSVKNLQKFVEHARSLS